MSDDGDDDSRNQRPGEYVETWMAERRMTDYVTRARTASGTAGRAVT